MIVETRRSRLWVLAVTVTCLLIFVLWRRTGDGETAEEFVISPTEYDDDPDALTDRAILGRLKLSSSFDYNRYCFHALQTPGMTRQSVVDMSRGLLDDSTGDILSAAGMMPLDELPPCRLDVDVPVPMFNSQPLFSQSNYNTRGLLLGMATKLSRIKASLPELSRWLSYSGVRLFVLVVDEPDLGAVAEDVQQVYEKAQALGIDLTLTPYPYPYDSQGKKNFGLAVPMMREIEQRPEINWIGIIDDDTFFVSLASMLDVLAQFDHRQPLYLGQLTEGFTRVTKEGFKAWGGAGIFITRPLLLTVAQNAAQCVEMDTGFGDIIWRDCIARYTSPTVQLTQIKGLNQIDVWGDIAGWYEAEHNPLITVHHWKSWHFHPVPIAHLVTDVAGPDSFLQRYLFRPDNLVLTNGFSLVRYPGTLPDLNRVELTVAEDVGLERAPEWKEFHLSFGQTRPRLEKGVEKLSWKFETALKTPDGLVKQFYVRRADKTSRRDSVIEIDWRGG